MQNETIRLAIEMADHAINNREFDRLMEFYTEDAILVVQPGVYARGRTEIRNAFNRISAYFNDSLKVEQGNMVIIESGDTALVLSKTFVSASSKLDSEFSTERNATYIYRKDGSGNWLCAIDNSYGTDLLVVGAA